MQSILIKPKTFVSISTKAKNWISKFKKNPDFWHFLVSFSSQKYNFLLPMCLNIFITKLSQFFPLLFGHKIVSKTQKIKLFIGNNFMVKIWSRFCDENVMKNLWNVGVLCYKWATLSWFCDENVAMSPWIILDEKVAIMW